MKATLCDVCYYQNSTLRLAGWNSRIKSKVKTVSLAVCGEHKGFFQGCNVDAAEAKANALYLNAVNVARMSGKEV